MSQSSTASTYRRIHEIAHGGMGFVELVVRRSDRFERLHALKRLHRHLRDDAEVRAMFLDEARIAGLIRHPNVVSVTDVGEDKDGPFLVMDYVEGASLSSLISRLGDPPSDWIAIALTLLTQIADGLDAAHTLCDSEGRSLGVVHRDISPHNVLVGFDGFARLTDFGIAKAAGRSSTKTETGVLKGKMGYLAPELLRFEDPTVQSDLFSFGVVLYELLTRRRLYSKRQGGPKAILNEPPPDIGEEVDVPDAVVELSLRLLSKDPALRPSSASEVARTLRDALYELEANVTPAMIGALVDARFERKAIRIPQEVPASGPRASARPKVALAGGALIGASLLAWLAFTRLGASDAPPPIEAVANAPSIPEPEFTGDAGAPDSTVEADANAGSEAGTDAEPAEPPPETRRRTTRMGRRVRRPPRGREASSGGFGTPMWEFSP